MIEVVEEYLYRPFREPFGLLVRLAQRLQSGRLDAYLRSSGRYLNPSTIPSRAWSGCTSCTAAYDAAARTPGPGNPYRHNCARHGRAVSAGKRTNENLP